MEQQLESIESNGPGLTRDAELDQKWSMPPARPPRVSGPSLEE